MGEKYKKRSVKSRLNSVKKWNYVKISTKSRLQNLPGKFFRHALFVIFFL